MENKEIVEEKSVPKILIEVLVYGVNSDKNKVKNTLERLQKQIDSNRKAIRRVRVLWYMDNGEKTNEEKREWLLQKMKCKYYIFANSDTSYKIEPNFIEKIINQIQKLEKEMKKSKDLGISSYKQITTETNNLTDLVEQTNILE